MLTAARAANGAVVDLVTLHTRPVTLELVGAGGQHEANVIH